MEDKVKVKVIRASSYVEGYGDYYDNTIQVLYPVSTDWEEVTWKERNEIMEAVRYANTMQKNGVHYVMIEYDDKVNNEIFQYATKFKEKLERDRKRDEKRKAEAAAKRKASAEARKRKQLEKLKKELGEE